MNKLTHVIGAALCAITLPLAAAAQDVTLRVHHFLSAQAPIQTKGLVPWAEKLAAESDGRIRVEIYPSMQLGGSPPSLFDQARDGVVDVIWTVLGYTPGRFPKSEVFELPFMVTTATATSAAFYDYVQENSLDEFRDVKLLAAHTHGPGLFHTRDPLTSLEDLKGRTIRGGSRVISEFLGRLGAEPIGMPVPETTEALARGVIVGTTSPWEVTPSLRTAEMVHNHTGFAGEHGLYTQTFALVMNQNSYDRLPDDLKAVIDANSGAELVRLLGILMDEADLPGIEIAQNLGNSIIELDEAETARWRTAAQPSVDAWIAEMNANGHDGQALYDRAVELVREHSAQ